MINSVTFGKALCYNYTDKKEILFFKDYKMKKIIAVLSILLFTGVAAFAQSDLQVLAIVKINKNESITLKQIKTLCVGYEKQLGRSLTVDEKKQLLDGLIEEKLIVQTAVKAGVSIPDSYVDQAFMQNVSQSLGVNITEKELDDYLRKAQNKTVEDVLFEQTGMGKVEYKSYLKNQLIKQQYLVQQNQAKIQQVAATDEEIRMAYESNKKDFVQQDQMKVFVVIVPKGTNPDAAKLKTADILNKYKDKKLTIEQIVVQSQAEGSGFNAGQIILPKAESSAAGLSLPLQKWLDCFSQKEGFIYDIYETPAEYRFFSIVKKYDFKVLAISDIIQPDTTITVYDYIRSSLTSQKQQIFMKNLEAELGKSLHTAENVEMKKTGDALNKLLDWGN